MRDEKELREIFADLQRHWNDFPEPVRTTTDFATAMPGPAVQPSNTDFKTVLQDALANMRGQLTGEYQGPEMPAPVPPANLPTSIPANPKMETPGVFEQPAALPQLPVSSMPEIKPHESPYQPSDSPKIPNLGPVGTTSLPTPVTPNVPGPEPKTALKEPEMPKWEAPKLPEIGERGQTLIGIDTDPLLPGWQNPAIPGPLSVSMNAELTKRLDQITGDPLPSPTSASPIPAVMPDVGSQPSWAVLAKQGLPGSSGLNVPAQTERAQWRGLGSGKTGDPGQAMQEFIKAVGELTRKISQISPQRQRGGNKLPPIERNQ